MPLDLRPKKTKKIRQALKPEQKYAWPGVKRGPFFSGELVSYIFLMKG